MGEYWGRAIYGALINLAYALIFLFATVALIIFLPVSVSPYFLILYIGLIVSLAIMTVFLFIKLHLALQEKRLVVNDIGIFLYRGERLFKKEYWNNIKKIGTTSESYDYPSIGFFVENDEKIYINNHDVIGSLNTLKKAFQEIANIASKRNIEIDDSLGWSRSVGGLEVINPEKYTGRWHEAKRGYHGLVEIFSVTVSIIGVTIFLTYSKNSILMMVGIGMALPALLVSIGIFADYLFTPHAIYFNDDSIMMHLPFNRVKTIPWNKIRKIGCIEKSGYLKVFTSNRIYLARFEPAICKAIKLKAAQRLTPDEVK